MTSPPITTPDWHGRMAPTGLKTYDAWEADPTRDYLDTPMYSPRTTSIWPRWLPWAFIGMLSILAVVAWVRSF